ncbi:unnamed protein product [Symbiodinium natans]|uniref:Uncharacterized protein n=1 Tax=Symbiodinium natans TaxID=878477 RepID=A0A812GNY6_9DINO|nr:unnamed protein product [Symbiodinium natans]
MNIQCFVPWKAHEAIAFCLIDAYEFGGQLAESTTIWLGDTLGAEALPLVLGGGLASSACSLCCSTKWPGVLGILFPSSSWQVSVVMSSFVCVSAVCFLHCQGTLVLWRGEMGKGNLKRIVAAGTMMYTNLTLMPVFAYACTFHPQFILFLLAGKVGFATGGLQFQEEIRRACGDFIKRRRDAPGRPHRPQPQPLSRSDTLWREFELLTESVCALLFIDSPAPASKALVANACSRVTATFGIVWLVWWPNSFFVMP